VSAASGSIAAELDCRQDFPILARRVGGKQIAYLDSAATSHRPNVVVDAIADFYRGHNANPAPALHSLARESHQLYEDSRGSIAEFINAYAADEIVFTRGTTEAINLVASAWGGANLRPGDEVLLTVAEHTSNLLPWRLVARQTRAVVRYANVDEAGRIDVEDFRNKLSKRTRHAIPEVRLLGPKVREGRVPVFSFVVEGHEVSDIQRSLDERGVAIRAGDLAALPLLRHFGVEKALRASCHVYSSREDVDRLDEGLREIVLGGSSGMG